MKRLIFVLVLLIGAGLLISFRRKILPAEAGNFAMYYKIRGCDTHGCGYFGASRGSKDHRGVDIRAKKGDPIPAPFDCVVKRWGRTYPSDTVDTLIEVEGVGLFKGYTAKIMHVFPSAVPGTIVKQFESLAVAEGIEDKLNGITPHYHFEFYDPQGTLLNPENFRG